MISKSAGPCPDVAEPEQDAGRAGQDVHPFGRDLLGLRLDLVDRLDLPAGGPHPRHARVHLEVDVAVVAPVGRAGVGLGGQRDRRRARERRDPHLVAALDEPHPVAVRREERVGGGVGPGDRRRVEVVEPPEPEAGAALRGSDVRQRPAVARDRDARSAGVARRLERLRRLEREAELAQERRGRRAEPAPERGGGRRGERDAEQRHEGGRPAARARAGAAAGGGASAAGIAAVDW